MNIAFYTLGCKVNQYETNAMAEKFIAAGHNVVSFDDAADVYIINTCSVTAESDRKSRQMIHRAKAKNPAALICAVGCYVQTAGAESDVFSDIDVVVGNAEKPNIVSLVENAPKVIVTDNKRYLPYPDDRVSGAFNKTRAVLKIEDGCNNFCSYCVIPYARGRVASKPFDAALSEFKGLMDAGIREVVVTGIEVASYGLDTGDSLVDLLCAFDAACNEGVRIRLGSLEPRIVTEEFAKRVSALSHVCPHFHLSLQSGCDTTLKRMNRKYDTARFAESAAILRKYFGNVALTTDLIVGFPGETDEEFAQTLEFIKKMRFLKVHIFPYSERAGTPAVRMDGKVSAPVKAARCKQAEAVCDAVRDEILQSAVGTRVEVLFETAKNGRISGYTKNYIPVTVNGGAELENALANALITGVSGDGLFGEI